MIFRRSPEIRLFRYFPWVALVAAAAVAAAAEPGFSRSVTSGLIAHYERLFGRGVSGRLQGWQEFVRRTEGDLSSAKGNALLAGRRLVGDMLGFWVSPHILKRHALWRL